MRILNIFPGIGAVTALPLVTTCGFEVSIGTLGAEVEALQNAADEVIILAP